MRRLTVTAPLIAYQESILPQTVTSLLEVSGKDRIRVAEHIWLVYIMMNELG